MLFGFFCAKSKLKQYKEVSTIIKTLQNGTLIPSELKNLIEQSLDADKAENIMSIKLDDQSGLADYMVIASGTSSRHVSAMTDKIINRLALQGIKSVNVEGKDRSDWVAIDAGDVIVHIFRPEVREFYNIEKMWGDFHPYEVVDTPIHA